MSRGLLVTGGAGFIGSNFVRYWRERHPDDRLVVLDALTYAGNLDNLGPSRTDPKVRFVHGDIGTPGLAESLLRDHELRTVVHFAAETHVDRSIAGPDPFLQTNVIGTHVLLKAAREIWLEEGKGTTGTCFHHISTDEVYGPLGPEDAPATEQSPYAPRSPYAASKAAADHLVRAYHHTYGLPVTITTCSNNFGPYQFPEKLIPLMLVHALEGKPLPIYGDGLQIRDWLYVEDHCRAIDMVLENGRDGQSYHVAGGNQWTNLAAVRLLCRLVDEAFAGDSTLGQRFPGSPAAKGRPTEALITHVQDRPAHDRRYMLDCQKVAREAGFRPGEAFEAGLRKTLAWYLRNEAWWRERVLLTRQGPE